MSRDMTSQRDIVLSKSLLTSYPPGGVEVPESEEAEGDGSGARSGISRPAEGGGRRKGELLSASITGFEPFETSLLECHIQEIILPTFLSAEAVIVYLRSRMENFHV